MIFLIINNLTFEAWPIHVTGSGSVHRGCCCTESVCTAKLKRRDAGEQGYRDLKWTGLWREGHMKRVEIHRPLYAMILAKALSCLQNANEQMKWDVKGRQPEPRMIYLRIWWRKHGWHHIRMQGGTQKTFQRGWGIFQKSKVESFGRDGNC